jgi:hypothetical protein
MWSKPATFARGDRGVFSNRGFTVVHQKNGNWKQLADRYLQVRIVFAVVRMMQKTFMDERFLSRQYFDSQLCTEIFFIFVKLLHEIGHACIIESGRHMNKHDPKRSYTPMTHCL